MVAAWFDVLCCVQVEAKAPVGHQFNIGKALDKKHEGKTFAQIIQLPPSALQGFGEKHDEMLAGAFSLSVLCLALFLLLLRFSFLLRLATPELMVMVGDFECPHTQSSRS